MLDIAEERRCREVSGSWASPTARQVRHGLHEEVGRLRPQRLPEGSVKHKHSLVQQAVALHAWERCAAFSVWVWATGMAG